MAEAATEGAVTKAAMADAAAEPVAPCPGQGEFCQPTLGAAECPSGGLGPGPENLIAPACASLADRRLLPGLPFPPAEEAQGYEESAHPLLLPSPPGSPSSVAEDRQGQEESMRPLPLPSPPGSPSVAAACAGQEESVRPLPLPCPPGLPSPAAEEGQVEEDAASAARPAGLPRFLAPLLRDWQSMRLGYVQVRQRPPGHGAESEGLDLCTPGADWQVIGQISLSLCGQIVWLEVFPSGSCPISWLRLVRETSRKHRVSWQDGRGDLDSWASSLLDTARKAAAWVEEEQGLCAELGAGLARLDCSASLPSELPAPTLTVALCVATMNRLWQLRRALPLNLIHCWPHRTWTRVYVVDFGSTDGTLEFLMSRCRVAIDQGLLVVLSSDKLMSWHASVAKNTAHMCATEEILVNLDSDNLIGPDFPWDVVQHFAKGYTVLQYEGGEGTCGRIACWRENFHKIRGYDEDCYPMGAQDVDLISRLRALPKASFRKVRSSTHCQAIRNTQDLKVRCCSLNYGGLRWGQMDTLNRSMFKLRLDAGQIVRNVTNKRIGVVARRVHAD